MYDPSPSVNPNQVVVAATTETQAVMQWEDEGGTSVAPVAVWIGDTLELMHWADDGGATTVA